MSEADLAKLSSDLGDCQDRPLRFLELIHSLDESLSRLSPQSPKASLLDEVQVLVHPLVLGKGGRLFPDGYHAPMKLADSKILSNGVVYLSYQIEHQA